MCKVDELLCFYSQLIQTLKSMFEISIFMFTNLPGLMFGLYDRYRLDNTGVEIKYKIISMV